MNSDCTVLISTSPIPSHPDTKFIDEVVANVRFHLPDSPIVIMADGIWDRLAHRREQYDEYLRRLKNRYPNTILTPFSSHCSQAKMTRMVLEANIVKTRYILFNEHDIPLRTDIKINWNDIFEVLQAGRADVIRLSGFIQGVHPEHLYLTYGETTYNESFFWKTHQWSQWPHLSSKEFYKQILGKYFAVDEIQMIEEKMHSLCQDPRAGWIRIWQYAPEGKDKRCFTHKEGRAGDPCHWAD